MKLLLKNKSRNKYIFLLCLISITYLITSCSFFSYQNNEIPKIFKYGLIYTSNLEKESEIWFLDKTWKVKNKISFPVNSLGTQTPTITSNHHSIYIPVTGRRFTEDKILFLDINKSRISYLDTDVFPIVAKTDKQEKYLYVIHNGSQRGTLTKINIGQNKIEGKVELNNSPRSLYIGEKNIYIVSDELVNFGQTITILDNQLKKLKVINHSLGYLVGDVLEYDNKLIISNNTKGGKSKDELYSDSYLELDLTNYNLSLKFIKYPPRQILNLESSILITSQNFPLSTSNNFILLDKKNMSMKFFLSKNHIYRATQKGDRLYVLGNSILEKNGPPQSIYEYDTKKFQLTNIHKLPKNKNLVISNFFVN